MPCAPRGPRCSSTTTTGEEDDMIGWILAARLALAASPAPDAPPPRPAAVTQAQADAAVATVLPQLEAIRGLTFKSKVPVQVIDVAHARSYALARFQALTPPS